MMGVSQGTQYTTLANLSEDIQKIVNAYRDAVLGAIGDGVQESAELFVKEVKDVSPYDADNHTTPHYKDSWKIKPMRRAKFVKYIGNTKKVKAHQKDAEPTIPLINILEFSKRVSKNNKPYARPHVGKAVANSKDQIFNIIVSKIKKEGNNA